MKENGTPNLTGPEIQILRDELLTDPAGIGYRTTKGKLKKPATLVGLLLERPEIENPDPPRTTRRTPTPDDLVQALEDPKVAKLAPLGWINQDEAIALAKIDLTVQDPTYKPFIPGPCRLEEILGRPVGGLAPAEIATVLAEPPEPTVEPAEPIR